MNKIGLLIGTHRDEPHHISFTTKDKATKGIEKHKELYPYGAKYEIKEMRLK